MKNVYTEINPFLFALMRLQLILFFVIPLSCSQNKNETVSPEHITETDNNKALDSISIEDIYANNPFPFPYDSISAVYFIKYINKPVEEITKQVQNIHDNELTDTLIALKWDNSSVEFYRSSSTTMELIDYANIYDTAFIFNKGIKIGMSLEEVKSKFAIFKNDKNNYKYIEFYFGEATDYTILFFENGKLKSVRYLPYTG
jgi:hypothetical protein